MLNKLIENHHVVEALWSAVNTSTGSLVNVAPLVKTLLSSGAWKEREIPQLGRVVRFERFADFINRPPLEGCGWPFEKIEALIQDDKETLELFKKAIRSEEAIAIDVADRANQRPAHVHIDRDLYNKNGDVQVTLAPTGNTRAAFLRRLRKDRPDIYARVLAGEITPHAGMIEAGFRKKPKSQRLTPFQQIERLIAHLWPRLSVEERQKLRAML